MLKTKEGEGILSEIKPATEMNIGENYKIKALLVSESGAGKTQSMTTMPGKILLIDYDGRKETVAGLEHIETLDCFDPDPKSPKAWDRGEKIRKEIWSQIRSKSFPFDSVVEDGLTRLLRYAMNWSLTLVGGDGQIKRGLGGAPAKQHYMPQMKNVSDHILSMLALPLHYGLTAHMELVEDEEMGGMKFLPKATGKMRTEIPGWFNETYHCFREKDKDGKVKYYWTTMGSGRWDFLKSTMNQLGKFWTDPISIDFSKSPVGFQDLWGRRFKEVKK